MRVPTEKLKEIETLVANGWCQNSSARDEQGRPVHPSSDRATCFCLTGAATRARVGLSTFAETLGFTDILTLVAWNDHQDRSLDEVLERIRSC